MSALMGKLSGQQIALALVLKELHHGDDAASRAVDRLLKDPLVPPLISFDGVEAIFQSGSEPEVQNVTTAEGCSCRGGRHPWCVHRVRFRILMAEMALRDPLGLLSAFVEHTPDDLRRPQPYPWPSPARLTSSIPELSLPDSLPPARPLPRVSPPSVDLQREIDELFPD
ncbi:hypothetical protein K2Z83_15690 [Oscillochloris sp. ZM17-4]|uniref:hypothetical protein n=1 Tax=Oscillochloris sp. ZM17-4 TaxID=2866714 RepID=UPI001C72CAF1|nr:hypothetical protein [Oscillochloris sp. ZM17-4]MBX0329120.1 hypothetical protein [Oscillochloris sp. ZM17-4]